MAGRVETQKSKEAGWKKCRQIEGDVEDFEVVVRGRKTTSLKPGQRAGKGEGLGT